MSKQFKYKLEQETYASFFTAVFPKNNTWIKPGFSVIGFLFTLDSSLDHFNFLGSGQ